MKEKIKKSEVLRAIDICSQLEKSWHSGLLPDSSFKNSVTDIRRLLGKLLKIKKVKIDKEK